VRIAITGIAVVTSSITNEAVDELSLTIGDDAYAIIKASNVIVARD
jgi:molybdopterin-binding protein